MAELIKLTTLDKLSRFKTKCDNKYMPKRAIDDTPTDNSKNLVTSGGVKAYVDSSDINLQKQIITLQELVNRLSIEDNSESGSVENVTSINNE